MPTSRTRPPNRNGRALAELRSTVTPEMIGLLLLAVGGFLLLSLRLDALPWLYQMAGWTAPLIAVGIAVTGVILMLGRRAGYWSIEALVGYELLLLALMAATFAWQAAAGDGAFQSDGRAGGRMGQVLGGTLVAALGRWPALFLLALVGIAAAAVIFYFTPLIYLQPLSVRWLGQLKLVRWRMAQRWSRRRWRRPQAAPGAAAAAPATQNFVPPKQPPPAVASPRAAAAAGGAMVATTGPDRKPQPATAARTQPPPAKPLRTPDELPPVALLVPDSGAVQAPADIRDLEQAIERTLADFNVPVKVVHVESGPTVTQFGVEPLFLERAGRRHKVRVSRIVNLADDLALALAAQSVRIEAPVPGQPFVGIEVPNPVKTLVGLRGIMESDVMRRHSGRLALPLGRNTAGAPVVMDLTSAPHLLIAGATGSGKSACINAIITGLLMQHGPEGLQFVMVDPKMVELTGYNGIPHLVGKVITDVEQVMGALTWLMLKMDDRYQLFRDTGVRNIEAYNNLAQRRKNMARLPYVVLVVDELADLMMTAPEDIERQICRLAQMARATGIHLVLATQRPSTDVVTGLIKANFPSRIAFAVTSQVDSRVILDVPGAERLLGRGDMLLMRADAAKLFRLQGCFVADEEINRVVAFWHSQVPSGAAAGPPPWHGILVQMDHPDELLQEAIDILREMDTCSTSMLQRKLRVGYPKAARIMEQLEAQGVVGPDLGGGQGRKVLLGRTDDEEEESEENNP